MQLESLLDGKIYIWLFALFYSMVATVFQHRYWFSCFLCKEAESGQPSYSAWGHTDCLLSGRNKKPKLILFDFRAHTFLYTPLTKTKKQTVTFPVIIIFSCPHFLPFTKSFMTASNYEGPLTTWSLTCFTSVMGMESKSTEKWSKGIK